MIPELGKGIEPVGTDSPMHADRKIEMNRSLGNCSNAQNLCGVRLVKVMGATLPNKMGIANIVPPRQKKYTKNHRSGRVP